ncbi:MAG: TIGR01212 family radical SAM protein [Bacilli bacterium]|nr:TIGR01212 family radical SAM protein [Bacilli bacterium]
MENYINSQHRYYTLDYYLKERFHKKVFKVALNGNFTCPNRDGAISSSGCIFCSPSGSGDFAGDPHDTLTKQFSTVSSIIHEKWPDALYIVYFQANTNTYKPLNELKKLYEEAIALSDKIVAISIATRPDCLSDEVIDYLGELNKRIPVWIELGLQTTNELTATLINRGYHLDVFSDAVKRLRKHHIEVIVHIINGLPFEVDSDMYNTVKYLNTLDIQGIKIHSLFVLKDTILAKMYENNEFQVMTMEKYIEITANQMAMLRKDIVIHRISGDAPKDLLIAPKWSEKKFVVMNEIDKYMKLNDLYQGSLYKNEE